VRLRRSGPGIALRASSGTTKKGRSTLETPNEQIAIMVQVRTTLERTCERLADLESRLDELDAKIPERAQPTTQRPTIANLGDDELLGIFSEVIDYVANQDAAAVRSWCVEHCGVFEIP
jgi:hypothetical protein